MRILLIQSLTEFGEPPIYPLGLSYIAAHLPRYDVEIFDMNTSSDPYVDLRDEIQRVDPGVVGLSLRNIKVATPGVHRSSFAPHEKSIRIIRRSAPGAIIIAGGAAFSLYAENIMERFPEIDLGVFGEGEDTFPEVLNSPDQPDLVRGVYYRREGKVLFTGYRDWTQSDVLGPPNRELVDMEKYSEIPFAIGVQAKRGCSLRCIHCADRYLLGEKIRLRDPIEVVDEIEELVESRGVGTFSFVDPVFNIPMDHARKICMEIIRRELKVKWTAWFNEKHIDEEFLGIVKDAGCAHLSFSPDSASNRVLRKLGKNFTSQELYRSCALAKKAGMKAEYSFMINAPGETFLTLIESLIFVAKAKFVLGKDFMLHNLLMTTPIRIYPHTKIREMAISKGIISKEMDLVEPAFYNPAPIKYVVSILDLFSRLAWWMKKRLKGGHPSYKQ